MDRAGGAPPHRPRRRDLRVPRRGRPARHPRRGFALWRREARRRRTRAGRGTHAAAAGRTGGRAERDRDRRDGRDHLGGARGPRDLRVARRARYGARDGDRRPGERARLRQVDRRRAAGAGAGRPRRHQGLPGQRRRRGRERGAAVNTFVQLVVNGLGKGAVYALLALGFVIIFKATEVINFAHGSLVLIGGGVVYGLQPPLGWAAAAAVGILGAGLAALLIERVILANARNADHNGLALLTIGIDVIITEEIVRRLGAAIPFVGDPYDAHPLQIAGITVFRTHAI